MRRADVLERVPGLRPRELYYLQERGYLPPSHGQHKRAQYDQQDVALLRLFRRYREEGYPAQTAIRLAKADLKVSREPIDVVFRHYRSEGHDIRSAMRLAERDVATNPMTPVLNKLRHAYEAIEEVVGEATRVAESQGMETIRRGLAHHGDSALVKYIWRKADERVRERQQHHD